MREQQCSFYHHPPPSPLRTCFGRQCPPPPPPCTHPFSRGTGLHSYLIYAGLSVTSLSLGFPPQQTKSAKSCLPGRGEDRKPGRTTFGKPVSEQMVRDNFQEPGLVSFQSWTSQRGRNTFIREHSFDSQVWRTDPRRTNNSGSGPSSTRGAKLSGFESWPLTPGR